MLTGKVALVTGASGGIGREIAITLASAGAMVIVNYGGSENAAQETVDTILANNGQAIKYQCDVSDFEACKSMIDWIIKEYKTLDILVNNAGITRDNLLLRMSEEEFDNVLSTNLKGCFNTIRHASRYLVKQRAGKIINIASVSGILGNAGQANYSAAKAGLIGLTKSCARELAARSIQVNAIAPGFIETKMTEKMSQEVLDAAIAQIPLRKMGSTKDVANLALFLAGEASDYITGQVICVDGGMAM